MTLVIERDEMVTEGTARQGKAMPSRLTTTLYDLITAVQDVVGPEDDALVVATVAHLLRSGQLTWLRTDHALRCGAYGVVNPAVRRLAHC